MSVTSFTQFIFHGRNRRTRLIAPARICMMIALTAMMSVGAAFSQTGKITGTVTDEAAATIPSVNVVLEGTKYGAATNDQGQYMISNVPAGSYMLTARGIGYRARSVRITVAEGQTVTQDFSLASDVLRANEVVVTGTMTPLPKIQSSVAISTITPEQLIMANPRSTTEVLRYIPGFTRIESSGGEVNQNYTMRGIYGVEYIMFLENGLPVFPTMHTFFMNADNLFRQDENIDHIEVVRGGNSALFGSNTPAAVINFIDKTGGANLQGSTKISFGTGDYVRTDLNLNGPIAGEDWRFNLGGFYRYDRGVRDPGFTGVKGGQFKANITRLLDNGYVRVSGKYINDQNQFVLDLPHSDPADPTVYAQGFGDYGSFNSPEGLNISVQTPEGRLNFPLDHGIKTDAMWLTGEIGLNFGTWNFKNQLQSMNDQQEWNAIVPFNAVPLDLWVLSEAQALQRGGFIPAGVPLTSVTARLTYTNQTDPTGAAFVFPNATLSPNNLVAPGGEWTVRKPISAVQDQFQIRKAVDLGGSLFYHHDFTVGLYLAHYTQTNQWFFSDILTDVQNQTHFLDAAFSFPDATAPGGTRTIAATKNGFMHYISNYVNGNGESSIFSVVLSDQMKITERLRLDLAWRWEQDQFVQSSENTSAVAPDGTPVTALTAPYEVELWGNNSYRHFSKKLQDWAVSAGLNFEIVPETFAFYAQASRAYKMPALDELLNASSPAQVALFEDKTTLNYEGGFKYSSPMFGFTIDGFWGELRNITGQGAILDTVTNRTTWVILSSPKQQTYGVEAEVTVVPIPVLTVNANGTVLKSRFGEGSDLGSWITGIPPFIGNANMVLNVAGLNLMGDVHYVGKRWVDEASNTFLPAYAYANFGIGYRQPTGKGMSLSLDLLNAFQSRGLEEGNPRLVQYPGNRTSNFFLARPVLPRRLMLSMGYQF